MQIRFFHLDAFADQPFSGNPAAVCLLNSWLDDEHLRKVAAENNLSATAFLVLENEDYGLRWFTPRCEVRLCGHATLAAGHLVLNVLQPHLDVVHFTTRFSGPLAVRRDDGFLCMDFPALLPKPCLSVPEVLTQALGLEAPPTEILEVNDILLAKFDHPATIRDLRPDFSFLQQLHPYAVLVTAPGDQADFVSRYFAPGYGVPEDPVTGSAHCVLAPYWAERLGKNRLHACQLSERGGELWCEMAGDRVILRGQALLTLQGTLMV